MFHYMFWSSFNYAMSFVNKWNITNKINWDLTGENNAYDDVRFNSVWFWLGITYFILLLFLIALI